MYGCVCTVGDDQFYSTGITVARIDKYRTIVVKGLKLTFLNQAGHVLWVP